MREDEWLTCDDPTSMLNFVRDKASDRKLRLFACACCRHYWHLLREPASRHAVLVAERFADGLASPHELEDAQEEAVNARREGDGTGPVACCNFPFSWELANHVAFALIEVMDNRQELSNAEWKAEFQAEADILRDLLGNPFLPSLAFCPSWIAHNDGSALRIAQTIYEERDFARLPDLADALSDAGCRDSGLLGHLRGPGPHVSGCWALDVVLGKS